MSKRIGILTFHRADNYGAVLQNYALQKACERLDCAVETIDYRCVEIEDGYTPRLPIRETRGIWQFIKWCAKIVLRTCPEVKHHRKFEAFRKHGLRLSPSYSYKEVMGGALNDQYDVLICGSDQIWNSNIVGDKNDFIYSLGFPTTSYKASCAASGGAPDLIRNETLSNIKKLDKITVREESLKIYLESEFSLKVQWVCDPVFLLSKEEWKRLIGNRKTHGKYIFMYYIENIEEVCAMARIWKKQRGMKVYASVLPCKHNLYFTHCTYGDDPLQFVRRIFYSECVIASSFHGVAFSIIFEKEFYVMLHESTGSRVRDLLEYLGLQDRIVEDAEDFGKKIREEKRIDYSRVKEKLNPFISASEAELRHICRGGGEDI